MRKSSVIFFQSVIVLIAIFAIAFLLWEPHLEGRNVNATLFEIYFKDPFLAYAYLASIPFFIAHYKAFRVLDYAGQDKFFSLPVLKALRVIKFCALAIICFVVVGEIYIISSISDDIAGGVFMGILITLGAITVGISAAVLEKKLRKANI